MISGRTTLIAHIGYPTETFKAPLIYNPYFEKAGIDAGWRILAPRAGGRVRARGKSQGFRGFRGSGRRRLMAAPV